MFPDNVFRPTPVASNRGDTECIQTPALRDHGAALSDAPKNITDNLGFGHAEPLDHTSTHHQMASVIEIVSEGYEPSRPLTCAGYTITTERHALDNGRLLQFS